ncbi:MAG: TlpA disulfide reductase family protein [Isosphaeraceae bacterium]
MFRGLSAAALALALLIAPATGQAAPRAADDLEAINADYARALRALDASRLERLVKLAASQPAEEANGTYEFLFRTAIQSNLFVEAEKPAEEVLKRKGLSAPVAWLAVFVNLIAEAKRGAYEDSLDTLLAMINAAGKADPADIAVIPEAQRASLLDAYYQLLVQADRFEIAGKAMAAVQSRTQSDLIRRMATNRLKQLALVNKPAPELVGTDIEGKTVRLADYRGKVVLLAYWATWSFPSAEEFEWFESISKKYESKGLRVIAINVDAMQEGGISDDSIVPQIRRYVIDRNLRWPVLLNHTGKEDYAGMFGVNEIPASVMIGKDGKVVHLDLRRDNLEAKVKEELAK